MSQINQIQSTLRRTRIKSILASVICDSTGGISSVVTDGVTITGDGTSSNPLVSVGASGALQAVADLADVASAVTSRQNLAAEHDRFTVTDKNSGFSPALADFAGLLPLYRCTASFTVTLPSDSTEAIPVGKTFYGITMSTYTTTFAAGGGATMETSSGGATAVASATENGFFWSATKRAANTWFIQNGRASTGSQMIVTFVGAVLTHTNLPAGVQRVSNVANRYGVRVDLTNASTIRAGVGCSLAGYAGSGWYCRYSTDGSSYTDIGTATGSNLALMTTAGINVSDAITLPAGAKSFVWLEIVSILGDGVADPVTGTLFAIIN